MLPKLLKAFNIGLYIFCMLLLKWLQFNFLIHISIYHLYYIYISIFYYALSNARLLSNKCVILNDFN